ncbi:MAG: hypothetical protein NTU98_08345 [Bacteroidetes bacterium]|nr:hypothetical protein [Bacteroidota bacterium]
MMKIKFDLHTITNWSLTLLFVIISATCIYVLIGAYTNVKKTTKLVQITTDDLNNRLNNPKLFKNDSILVANEKAFLNQYEIRTKGTLDSTTISFLFQIFAIALVSAGVYLFSSTHKDYKKIKKSAQKHDYDNQVISMIKTSLTHSYFLSWTIRMDSSQKRLGMIAQLREEITDLHYYLFDDDSFKTIFKRIVVNDPRIGLEMIETLRYCRTNLTFRADEKYTRYVDDINAKIANIDDYLIKRLKLTIFEK